MNIKNTILTKLLYVDDFGDGVLPSPEFNIHVERLKFGSEEHENVSLVARYDRYANLDLLYKGSVNIKNFLSMPTEIEVGGNFFPKTLNLLIQSCSNPTSDVRLIKMIPKWQPFLMDFGEEAKRIEAVIINGPNISERPKNNTFEYKGLSITVSELPSTKEHREDYRSLQHEYIATQKIEAISLDGSTIPHELAFTVINHFSRFLTFVRGGKSNIGNIIGYSPSNELAYAHIGFAQKDQFQVAEGWFDGNYITCLSDLYKQYTSAVEKKEDTYVLLRAIEFYRDSNIARDSSPELALVASCASLETLVPHILSSRAGWSSNLLGLQSSFHDKIRAAATFIGLNTNLYEHLPEIEKKAKILNNIDAYEMLTRFRNQIVHQGKPFKYSALELMEAWQFSQWLAEIVLFYYLGYRGKMIDRREYGGYVGSTVQVPLPPIIKLS